MMAYSNKRSYEIILQKFYCKKIDLLVSEMYDSFNYRTAFYLFSLCNLLNLKLTLFKKLLHNKNLIK